MAMTKHIETLVLFFLIGLVAAAGNTVGSKVPLIDSVTAMLIISAIASVGLIISRLPGFGKLPLLFWVSVVAIYVSTPYFPWSPVILAATKKMQFLAICTPILAYAGLAVGKDLAMFRRMSWRIVPVALAVFAGTFLFAALIAEVTLHWEGAIP